MFDTYTPGQAPLLRRLLGLFPKKPPHTPLHKPPLPRGRGPSAPSPMYSPPVFCLTSTEILNVLSSPGPVYVSKGGEDALGSGGSCCKCEVDRTQHQHLRLHIHPQLCSSSSLPHLAPFSTRHPGNFLSNQVSIVLFSPKVTTPGSSSFMDLKSKFSCLDIFIGE